MANYNDISELVAGVSNATQLRMNTKQDDGTDTIAGVDWFTYAGVVCNNLYANGNSWVGLGASQEDLKVNSRDTAMYNLWREEGTIRAVKFLRVRWGGYASYNNTNANALFAYDVILFDTGDMTLYIADIPELNYDGAFALGSLSYEKPTASNRYVSFLVQEDGAYAVQYAPIEFYAKKYLVRDAGVLYTVVDGALSELTGELNAELFQSNGMDMVPDGEILKTLTAPDVLCWTDAPEACSVTATVQGAPTGSHEIVSDHIRVGHSTIYGMLSVTATASENAEFLVSFDGGEWMIYTDDGTWAVSDFGMTTAQLLAVPMSAWDSVISSAQYMQLKAVLDGADTVTQVVFNFNNESPVTQAESEV